MLVKFQGRGLTTLSPPTAPTVAYTDQADGTGFTTTLTGSVVGSTNEVFYAPWGVDLGNLAFASGGSVTSDGSVDVAVSAGMYWAYVESTVSGVSTRTAMAAVRVTGGDDAVYVAVLEWVQATVQALGLEGINSASVVIRRLPYDDRQVYHGITVSPDDPREAPSHDDRPTNCRDMIGYPVVVTIAEGIGRGVTGSIPTVTLRRQKIFRAVNNKRITLSLPTGVNSVICKARQKEVTVPRQYLDNTDMTQLVVWCWVLEPRTN